MRMVLERERNRPAKAAAMFPTENDGGANFEGNEIMTYIDGKRCWVNKVTYGDASARGL